MALGLFQYIALSAIIFHAQQKSFQNKDLRPLGKKTVKRRAALRRSARNRTRPLSGGLGWRGLQETGCGSWARQEWFRSNSRGQATPERDHLSGWAGEKCACADFPDALVAAVKVIASNLHPQSVEKLDELKAAGEIKEICNAKKAQ